MTALRLENFIDLAVDTLRAELPDRIAVIDGEHDDFTLPQIAADAIEAFGEATITKYPSVEVAAPDWQYGRPSIDQRSWDGSLVMMARIWWQHPHFQTLTRGLYRYQSALTEVLMQPDCFGTGESVQAMRGMVRVNPETNTRHEFTAGALIVCTLDAVAVRP